MTLKIQPFIIAAIIGFLIPQVGTPQKPIAYHSNATPAMQGLALAQPIAGQVIFSEDFESASAFPVQGITTTTQGTDGGFKIGSSTNGGWEIPAHGTFSYSNDDVCNCDKSQDVLQLPNQDFSTVASAVLEFDVYHDMNAGEGMLYIEIDTGSGYAAIDSVPAKNNWQFFQTPLPRVQGKSTYGIRFIYNDNGAWATGVAIDNITIKKPNNNFALGLSSSMNFPSLHQIPANHAAGRLFEHHLTLKNLGLQNAQNTKILGNISGEEAGMSHFNSINIPQGDKQSISAHSPFVFPNKMGQYTASYYPSHDSISGQIDTISFSTFLTDTLMSYDMHSLDTVGLWYGSGNRFSISSEFTFNKPDTITSVYVYIHEHTAPDSRIDVDIYNALNQPIIPSAFPQSNLNVSISENDIGTYMLIRIPKTPIENGNYRVSVMTRTDSVVLSCAALPFKSRKSSLRIGTNVTNTRYLPIIGVNLSGGPCSLTLQPATANPSCGLSDGSIKMNYTGNSGTPSFRWDYNDTVIYNTDSISLLPAGIYTAHVTDNNGCYKSTQIALSNVGGPTIDSVSTTPAGCYGSNQGKAVIHHTNGSALQYRFENHTISPDSIFDTLKAGTYTIEAFHPSSPSCITQLLVEIEGGQTPLSVTVQGQSNFCYDDTDGKLSAQGFGGTPPYAYKWIGVSQDSLPYQDQLRSGFYPLELSDAFQCVYRDTFEVGSQPRINLAPITDDEKGYIVLNASQGNSLLSYNWSGPNGFKNPGTDSIFGLFVQGNYSVTIIDENGCTRDTTFQMTGTLSVEENAKNKTLVYPNPTNGILNIHSPNATELSLYNQQGELIFQKEIEELTTLSLQGLPKGLYLLHVEGGQSKEPFKILLR